MLYQKEITLIVLFLAVAAYGFEALPYNSTVQVQIKNASISQGNFFDLSTIPSIIQSKKWYAFVLLTTNKEQFWKRFNMTLSAVNRLTNYSRGIKVNCSDQGSQTSCFISSDEIIVDQEYLLVDVRYEKEASATLRLDVDNVKEIEFDQSVSIKKGTPDFNRIFSLDLSKLPKDWKMFTLELQQQDKRGKSNSLTEWGFMTSVSEIPPRELQYDKMSGDIWDGYQVNAYNTQELAGKSTLTILVQIQDMSNYTLMAQVVNYSQPQVLTEGVNRVYWQGTRRYIMEFSTSRTTEQKTQVQVVGERTLKPTNYQLNGRNTTRDEFVAGLAANSMFPLQFSENQMFVANYNVTSIGFDLQPAFNNVNYPIQVLTFRIHTINYTMPEIPSGTLFMDTFSVTKPRYLYLKVTAESSDELISLAAYVQSSSRYYIAFRSCKTSTDPLVCSNYMQNMERDPDNLNMERNFPPLGFKKVNQRYMIRSANLPLQKVSYNQHQYEYQALIIAEINSTQSQRYDFYWVKLESQHKIRSGQPYIGSVDRNVDAMYFRVPDRKDIKYAKVHILVGSQVQFFGSDVMLYDEKDNNSLIIPEIDGSVTFYNVTPGKLYYVYVGSPRRTYYEVHLTYSFASTHQNVSYALTHIQMSEDSRTQRIIKPNQILFVQIKLLSKATQLVAQNPSPLFFCKIESQNRPQSAADLSSSSLCYNDSATHSFTITKSDPSKRVFMAIQNNNTYSVPVLLITETETQECAAVSFGHTHSFTMNKTVRSDSEHVSYCASYDISEFEDIEVFVDIVNPVLKGMKKPTVKIGSSEITMDESTLIVTEEELKKYCNNSADDCSLVVTVEQLKEHVVSLETFSVSVTYKDDAVSLMDGVQKDTQLNFKGKHFKYAMHSNQQMVVLAHTKLVNFDMVATVAGPSTTKFSFPTLSDSYNNNVFKASKSDPYKSQQMLHIPQYSIPSECKQTDKGVCYLLITVTPKKELPKTSKVKLSIEVIQHIGQLKEGKVTNLYIPADSVKFLTFKNYKSGNQILFLSNSRVTNCSYMYVYDHYNFGNNSSYTVARGAEEAIVNYGYAKTYTVAVRSGEEDCSLTIQASTSTKKVYMLRTGNANYYSVSPSRSYYYLLHVHDETRVKMITSMSRSSVYQVKIRAMPVTDDKVSNFLKYASGNETKGVSYLWSGINHMTVDKDDGLCSNCYICIEVSSASYVSGSLYVAEENHLALIHASKTFYDILDKGDTFSWMMNRGMRNYEIVVTLLSGKLQITVTNSTGEEVENATVSYSSYSTSKSTVHMGPYNLSHSYNVYSYFNITAVEDTDYKITTRYKSYSSSHPYEKHARYHDLDVGRPQYYYTSYDRKDCFNGTVQDKTETFTIFLSDYHTSYKYRGKTIQAAINTYLDISSTLDGKNIIMQKEYADSTLTLSFEKNTQINYSHFELWIGYRNTSIRYYFYRSGNLTFLPENTTMRVKQDSVLSFMGRGTGIIEVDACSSNGSLMLTSRYDEIDSYGSKVKQQKLSNHLVSFTKTGFVYLVVRTNDFMSIKWRPYYSSTYSSANHNGQGYSIYSPGSFTMDYVRDTDQVNLKIQPIRAVPNDYIKEYQLPRIFNVTYKAAIARNESSVYAAINCHRGDYLEWTKVVEENQAMSQVMLPLTDFKDIKAMFRWDEHILVSIKAEVVLQWTTNGFIEDYRFYYPYLQVFLPQYGFSDEEASSEEEIIEEEKENKGTAKPVPDSGSSTNDSGSGLIMALGYIFLGMIIMALVVGLFLLARWAKRGYLSNGSYMNDSVEGGSNVMSESGSMEMGSRHSGYGK